MFLVILFSRSNRAPHAQSTEPPIAAVNVFLDMDFVPDGLDFDACGFADAPVRLGASENIWSL
jgi:hypothetical protein